MSLAEFNRTILDYLVWSGQEKAAITFWYETGSKEAFDLDRASAILTLKEAIRNHDFAQAWQLALDIDGTRLMMRPEIEICFALAQIIEALVTDQPALSIIEQAKHTVSPLIHRLAVPEQKAQFELMLEHIVSLLIVPQSNPPVKALLEPARLEQWVLDYVQDFFRSGQSKHNRLATEIALYESIQ